MLRWHTLGTNLRLALGPEVPTYQSQQIRTLSSSSCVILFWSSEPNFQGAARMEWSTPQHEEIELNCEVSSYANAEL
jgi:hypothetical protein